MKPKDIEGILKVSNALIKKNVEQVEKKLEKVEYFVKDSLQAQELRTMKAIERAENTKDGKDGINGKDGRDGKDGVNGKDGLNGRDGKDGRNGINGRDGVNGVKGDKGDKGPKGDDGDSAYRVAVRNGYKGNEREWLESLKAEITMIPNQIVPGYTNPLPPRGKAGQVLAKKSNQDRDYEWVDQSGGGGAVSSVFNRTGDIVAQEGDYTLAQITEDSTHRTVTDAEKLTWNGKADTNVATTSVNGLMSSTDKTKLDGVATNANNYTHPANHPPSIITQDTSNRFVTDAEKTTWNGKQDSLVSNTNIKTINGESVLGSGNIVVSGAVGGSTAYFLTSNFSNSTTTLADVTEWTFPVVSGKKYKVEIIGTYQTNTTTTGGKLAVYARDSAVTTVHGSLWGAVSDVQVATEIKATIYTCAASNATGSFVLTTGVATINRPHAIGGEMVISCTTSGNVRFQWAGEAATAAQLNSGSVMIVTPLN